MINICSKWVLTVYGLRIVSIHCKFCLEVVSTHSALSAQQVRDWCRMPFADWLAARFLKDLLEDASRITYWFLGGHAIEIQWSQKVDKFQANFDISMAFQGFFLIPGLQKLVGKPPRGKSRPIGWPLMLPRDLGGVWPACRRSLEQTLKQFSAEEK